MQFFSRGNWRKWNITKHIVSPLGYLSCLISYVYIYYYLTCIIVEKIESSLCERDRKFKINVKFHFSCRDFKCLHTTLRLLV